MPVNGILWLLLPLTALLGFALIRWGRIPFAKGSGVALVGFVVASLAYVSYQIAENFRLTDLLVICIVIMIPAGIACVKWGRSAFALQLGAFLLCLAGSISVYFAFVMIRAIFFSSTQIG